MSSILVRTSSSIIKQSYLRTVGSYISRKCSQLSEKDEDPSINVTENIRETSDYRFFYPEFLPEPMLSRRHPLREKLERMDMFKRRKIIEIPEFYVGSILSVTVSDPYAANKTNRFVGICISRENQGLRASFILRNVVDNLGVEIMYELYNPSILKLEVLKLEKRLDDHLYYLRDALPEYSTFPFDMIQEMHADGSPIPVNPIKVKLKPRPWHERWERQDLKGVQDLGLPERFYVRAAKVAKPYEKFDLMKQYRKLIPKEQQLKIMSEVQEHHTEMDQIRLQEKKLKLREKIHSKKK